jgi:hypothetical protein
VSNLISEYILEIEHVWCHVAPLDISARRLSLPSFCLSNENVSFLVAITWKDAPENQSPVAGNDYVVRCVVTANPPPTIGKKKQSKIVEITRSTNRDYISTRLAAERRPNKVFRTICHQARRAAHQQRQRG